MDNVVNGNQIAVAVVMVIFYWKMLCLELCGKCCCHHCVVVVCGTWKATVAGVMATYVEQVAGAIANVAD